MYVLWCLSFTVHRTTFYGFFFLRTVSKINIMKTATFNACWLILMCFHNPSNSDVDYRIFSVCM